MLALLERIKLQDAGLAEPPPIGLRGYVPAAATAAARGYSPGGARDARPDWRDVVEGLGEEAGEGSGPEDLGSDDEGGGERGARARAAVGASSSEGGGEEVGEEESEEGDEAEDDSDDDDDEDVEVRPLPHQFGAVYALLLLHHIIHASLRPLFDCLSTLPRTRVQPAPCRALHTCSYVSPTAMGEGCV